MATALKVYDVTDGEHVVPHGSELEKCEQRMAKYAGQAVRSLKEIAAELRRIRDDELFKQAGFDSFSGYMNERQPCGVKKTQAIGILRADDVRACLPKVSELGGRDATGDWTEWIIRPLVNPRFNKADWRRIGRKIATRIRNGSWDRLTHANVKKLVDEELGTTRQKAEKKAKALDEVDSPAETLRTMIVEVKGWKSALESVPGHFWEDAEEESPGAAKRLARELSSLASFLRS